MKTAEQAFRNRWPMSDDKRAEILEHAMEILRTSEKERNRIAAARLLMEAEKQNQNDEHKILDKFAERRIAELDQVAIELGLDPATIEAIANNADGSS